MLPPVAQSRSDYRGLISRSNTLNGALAPQLSLRSCLLVAGVSCIIAGFTRGDPPCVYRADPSGSVTQWRAVAVGGGSSSANSGDADTNRMTGGAGAMKRLEGEALQLSGFQNEALALSVAR